MQERHFIAAGAINMFISVGAGAFGAHALRQVVSAEMLATWSTAANYQAMHALGLMVIALLMPRFNPVWLRRAGFAMLTGIVIFSGSLYALVLSGNRILGMLTPVGGLAFLLAWAMLAWAMCRLKH